MSSGDLLTRLGDGATPDQSIGILSAEVAQDNRGHGQGPGLSSTSAGCAVYPDSDETSNDKANVRSGRYPIWGPVAPLARLNAGGGYPAERQGGRGRRLPRGHAPHAGGPRPGEARGAAPRDPPVRDARAADAGDGAGHAVCAAPAPAAATTRRSRPACTSCSLRDRRRLPGERARLQLRLLRTAVSFSRRVAGT